MEKITLAVVVKARVKVVVVVASLIKTKNTLTQSAVNNLLLFIFKQKLQNSILCDRVACYSYLPIFY